MTTQAAPARPGADKASGGKLVPLEAMRGAAAAVVVLYHVILAFTAKGVTSQPATGHAGLDLLAQFLLGLVNGSAAVAVFFVLSGFLVSLPFARSRDPARIAVSVLKRWPRLAGLTMLGCLLSWLLLTLFGDVYARAGAIIGNGWMTTHANGPLAGHSLSPLAALWQGAVPAFTTGDVWFDPPLWTMRIELLLSVGALTFLALHAALGQALATALAALLSIGLAVAVAVPLFRVDQAWTKLVNRAAAPLQPAKSRA